MRWNIKTAQNMLTLKSKQESNRWSTDVAKPFLEYCRLISSSGSVVDLSACQ
ncbi:MAG: hypothetical protein LBS18_06315 [Clostridiales bacterium]|nr:hypothetical protein [Clostridiales bacterium]